MAMCPKCKNNTVQFINRKTGSSGVGFRLGGTRYHASNVERQTIGVCSTCGYTFNQTKRRASNEANRIKKEAKKKAWKEMPTGRKVWRIFLYIILCLVIILIMINRK